MEEKNEVKNEVKKGKKIILPITIVAIIMALIAVIVVLALKLNNNNNNEPTNISSNTQTDKTKVNITSENKQQVQTVSFKSMEATDESLTDEQQLIASFFDEDYFWIGSYEEIVRYTDMLKNINITMYCDVNSILSSDDKNFEALCNWKSSWDDFEENNYLMIIKGKKPSKMIVKGDFINVRGKLIGAETREINGKSEYLPVIEVTEIGENTFLYDKETLRQITKIIFGNNVKFRAPTNDEIEEMVTNFNYTYQDYVYLAEFENQSNLNFKVFDIWQSELGLITYNGIYNQGVNKQLGNKRLYITPDLQKYIVFDCSDKDKYVYISVYDRNLNKLFSREISEVSQVTWDGTNENLVFISDNDFYNIDLKTGEDIWNPIYVGKRRDIRIVDNGYIILSNDSDDTIMFLDAEGKAKNKYDLKLNENEKIDSTAIQKNGSHYVILFNIVNNSYEYSSKYVIIDENGNKINESK